MFQNWIYYIFLSLQLFEIRFNIWRKLDKNILYAHTYKNDLELTTEVLENQVVNNIPIDFEYFETLCYSSF